MTPEGEARMLGLCMFCTRATHDYPRDAEHERLHAEGWHTCGRDGVFRQSRPLCKGFDMAAGAVAVW